jgi:hypothetical protein
VLRTRINLPKNITEQFPVEAENCIITKVSPHCLLLPRKRETLRGKYPKYSTDNNENELPVIVSSPSED